MEPQQHATGRWTVARIAAAYDRASESVYGTEEPPEEFESLAELRRHVDVYGFDCTNELLGYRLFGPEENGPADGPYRLLLTFAAPRKGLVKDWSAPVPQDAGDELSAFLTHCRARAQQRVAEAWPLPGDDVAVRGGA